MTQTYFKLKGRVWAQERRVLTRKIFNTNLNLSKTKSFSINFKDEGTENTLLDDDDCAEVLEIY